MADDHKEPVEIPIGKGWRLDKHIPIALIVTVLIAFAGQTGGIIWWAATFSATTNTRLTALESEREQDRNNREADRRAAANRDLSIRALEIQLPNLVETVERMDEKLDRLIERQIGRQ